MIIIGKNAIKEALSSSDVSIKKLYVQKDLHNIQQFVDLARDKKVMIEFVSKQQINSIAESDKHQGLVAEGSEYKYFTVDEIVLSAKSLNQPLLVLILDGIEDPHNLGSIIRVAECAGVHGVIIPKHRSVAVNETVSKVSAGAISHMRVAMVTNINDTIRKLKEDFVNVLCADMDGVSIYNSHLTGDLALVIGGEGDGVKLLTKKLCDGVISIPQFGKVNSLNASVATGIVTYEAVRQRIGK